MMNTTILLFWLIAVIVFGVAEIFTIQLTAIWFSIGSVAGMVACSFGAPLPIQLLAFAIVSLILLALTRPFVRRFLTMREVRTNADRLIGKTALVTEDIRNLEAHGAVIYSGVTWTARSEDGSNITKGEKVTIQKIEGSKLIVSKPA